MNVRSRKGIEMAVNKEVLSFLNKRQLNIAEIIQKEGSVRVSDLSLTFDVSDETIRRDLEKLEEEGVLKRVHGGAILKTFKEGKEIPVITRTRINRDEKEMIAKRAAEFVKDGDIIAIDASTTGLCLTKYIKHKKITVITNTIPVALDLLDAESIQVILIGGFLATESVSLVGNMSEKMIEGYHVDKFFFSCRGVDFKRGVSEIHEPQASMKKQIISISDELYLLVDHSKFNEKSLIGICDIQDVDYIITDNKVPIETINKLNNIGIQTFIGKE